MADSVLFDMQAARGVPLSTDVQSISDPLIPQQATRGMLSHFFEEIYDLRPESHLSRLLGVLLGDAGVGSVRKRYTYTQITHNIQNAHFYELDRLFADIFGFKRFLDEALDFDPATQAGTLAEWEAVLAADASYRNRVHQFVRGISWGATPFGMALVASATVGHPCRIYESYVNVDLGVFENSNLPALQLTYGELEAYTYGLIEGRAYGDVESTHVSGSTGGGAVPVSPIEAGPGGTSGSPRVLTLPQISTTPNAVSTVGFSADLYYRYVPTADGQVVVDTSYTTMGGHPLGEPWQSGYLVQIVGIGGGTVTDPGTPGYKDRKTIHVTSGTPLTFRIHTALTLGVISLPPPPMDVRVVVSANGQVDPWNIYSPMAIKPSRTNFTVHPLRPITPEERYHLIRVLDRLKPVNSRVIIDQAGVNGYDRLPVTGVYSPSVYWSVRSKVIPAPGTEGAYARVGEEGEAVEQPTTAFNDYQGEEWSYNGDVLSVISYAEDETGVFQPVNYDRVVNPVTEKVTDHLPGLALTPLSEVIRGEMVRDGVLTVSPIQKASV